MWTLDGDHFVTFRCDRSTVASEKKTKGAGVIILIRKILHPKLRADLSLIHQKYDSIWVEYKTSKNKTERSTLLNISYNQNKSNKTEFVNELALSVEFAQSYNSNIVLMGDYNPNYLITEEKESLDTILTPYHLEVFNKLTRT